MSPAGGGNRLGGVPESSSIRNASTRPVPVGSLGAAAGRTGREGEKGAFTWLCRDGSQAQGSASHLAISSPPPSSTQFGPPVP